MKRVLNDNTRCHDEARTWHHSALSTLAGVGSHSTDQPGGKVHGQVKLAIWSSNVSPENKVEPQARLSILILNKTYPNMGILSPLPRHARLLARGFVFAEKQQRVSPYFQILSFSSSSINRSTLASIQKHTWWKQLFFIIQPYFSSSLFHFLLYVAKGLSSLNIHERRTIRIEFVNLARQT